MKRFRIVYVLVLAALLTVAAAALVTADTRTLTVNVPEQTGKPVPVSILLDDIRRAVGLTFTIDWESLRVYDTQGELLPFQIDDTDLSGGLSRDDHLVFSTVGSAAIEVARVADAPLPDFENAFSVSEIENGWLIEATDGSTAAEVTKLGGINLVRYDGIDRSFARDMGFVRYAGFPFSTYWVNGDLKAHEEKTTLEEPMRVVSIQILNDSPVRATVIVQRASDLFPGLRQHLIVGIYKTGEVLIDQVVTSAGYADMTKLLTIVNGMLAGAPDSRHMLPVFRQLEWADELEITPTEYWAQRDVITDVNGQSYIAFKDMGGPVPLWWGAGYIFASPERWRTNYSAQLGLGMAEMLVGVPPVADDLRDRLESRQWQLEGEWRYGYFRWIPDEVIDAHTALSGDLGFKGDMEQDDWPLHLIPGDKVSFTNYYVPYTAGDKQAAIQYLEDRYTELTAVSMKVQ